MGKDAFTRVAVPENGSPRRRRRKKKQLWMLDGPGFSTGSWMVVMMEDGLTTRIFIGLMRNW